MLFFKKKETKRNNERRMVHFEIYFEPFFDGEVNNKYTDEELEEQYTIACMKGFNKDLIKKGTKFKYNCKTIYVYD